MVCVSMDEEQARNEIKVIQGEWGSGVPHSPPTGGTLGGKNKGSDNASDDVEDYNSMLYPGR